MKIKALRDLSGFSGQSARWFHEKWEVSEEAYAGSIDDCIKQEKGIPQWYIAIDKNGDIIAGAGVVNNDFHERKDLSPNLCALFVEENYRGKGIAKELLEFVRKDLCKQGFQKLYLVTDHIGFYEKYGWKFLTTVTEDSGERVRLYVADTKVSD